MAKSTHTKNSESLLSVSKFYEYEITVYAITPDSAVLIAHKVVNSSKEMNFTAYTAAQKKGVLIEKTIELIAAPEEYLKTNGYIP